MVPEPVAADERRVLASTYQLERKIATGGMGVVYEASHVSLPLRFAVKVWTRRETDPEDGIALERFRREAEVAASLTNQHVVRLHDYRVGDDGYPYIVMELLEGEDLSARLKRERRLSSAQVTRLVSQIAQALDAAHALGVVHRDLKPANVFLHRFPELDFVKVLDFGVSKMLDRSGITQSDILVGTPAYMSPEQASGDESVLPASDVFSLGVIAYEALTGTRPFVGESIPTTLYQIVHGDPVPVSTYLGAEAAAVDVVMARVLAKRAGDRYGSASSFAVALQQALAVASNKSGSAPRLRQEPVEEDHQTRARKLPTVQLPVDLETQRTRRTAALIAVAAVVAVVIGAGIGLGYRRARSTNYVPFVVTAVPASTTIPPPVAAAHPALSPSPIPPSPPSPSPKIGASAKGGGPRKRTDKPKVQRPVLVAPVQDL